MIVLGGLDLSINSSGITKITLDDDLNIKYKNFLGFSSVQKHKCENIITYKKDQFKDELDKDLWFKNHIVSFLIDCDIVAIEGYSYGSFGINYEIGQFAGLLKYSLYELGTKLRIYDINSIKMFATGSGGADKMDMLNAFIKHKDKFDISKLPILEEKKRKKGISPTSDVVDSFHICMLLLTEMKLRKGLVKLKDLSEETIRVFNRVTKAFPVNILDQDFISKD